MRIEGITPYRRLVIDAPFHELEVMRSLPVRKWDKASDRWFVPAVKQNIVILRGHGVTVEVPPVVVPTSLDWSFTFKTDPMPHQAAALMAGKDRDAFGLFMDPGTGKSKILIDDAVAAHRRGEIDGVLLICPNSIKGNWLDELEKHHAGAWAAMEWEPGREKKLTEFLGLGQSKGLRWFIVGVESLSAGSGIVAANRFVTSMRCEVAVDESSRIKNHDKNRTKTVIKIAEKGVRRRIATGTPATQGPQNLWAQFEALDPNILDLDYYPFRAFFCVMGGYKQKQIVAAKNEDILFDMVAPFVFQARKSECLNLPPKVHQRRIVQPSAQQLKLYNDLLATGNLTTSNGTLTFDTALVRDLRLHQLTGGFVATQKSIATLADLIRNAANPEALMAALADAPAKSWYEAEPIPGPNPKIEELKAIVEDMDEHDKLIVWSRYRAEIAAVVEALEPYGKAVQFHGGIPREDRDAARRAFQEDPGTRFFVGQIQTGGIGITLTAASTVVYFSNDWSAENRIQSEDRIHRHGQTGDSCLYIDLLLDGRYMDKRVLNAVQAGMDYHEAVASELAGRLEKNFLTSDKH